MPNTRSYASRGVTVNVDEKSTRGWVLPASRVQTVVTCPWAVTTRPSANLTVRPDGASAKPHFATKSADIKSLLAPLSTSSVASWPATQPRKRTSGRDDERTPVSNNGPSDSTRAAWLFVGTGVAAACPG